MKATTILTICVIATVLLTAISMIGIHEKPINQTQFDNYQITDATMDSPAIIIKLQTPQELTTQATKLNTTTIYNTNKGYAIIDTQNDIGYLLPKEQLWYGDAPAYYSTLLMIFSGAIIITFLIITLKNAEW